MKNFTTLDKNFMSEAIVEARRAFEKGEVPVGAVLVVNNEIVARGHNLVESTQDATMHAEIVCMRHANAVLKNWRLLDSTLYVTMEPCSMCAGAAILSRVSKIVWGCPDIRHGACGSWMDLFLKEHPIHQVEILSNLLEDEAKSLIQEFFRKRREEKKCLAANLK